MMASLPYACPRCGAPIYNYGGVCDTAGCKPIAQPLEPMPEDVEAMRRAVEAAMDDEWQEICADTGCHPLDVEQIGRGKLRFLPRHWARAVGERVARLVLADRQRAVEAERAQICDVLDELTHAYSPGADGALIIQECQDAIRARGAAQDPAGMSSAREVIIGTLPGISRALKEGQADAILRALDAAGMLAAAGNGE